MTEPEQIWKAVTEIKPYFYGIWCSIADGDPFVNPIVLMDQKVEGKITFMLDSFNFITKDIDDEILVVPIEVEEGSYYWKEYHDYEFDWGQKIQKDDKCTLFSR